MKNVICPLKYAAACVASNNVISETDDIERMSACNCIDSFFCPFFIRSGADEQCRLIEAVNEAAKNLPDEEIKEELPF